MGRNDDHARLESGWPAALERAKSPDYYLAMTSLTGPKEAWFVTPWESHAAVAESMKREEKDPVSPRRWRGSRSATPVHQLALEPFKRGRGQSLARRFSRRGKGQVFQITVWRVRFGHQQQFEEAAKRYAAARVRSNSKQGYRFTKPLRDANANLPDDCICGKLRRPGPRWRQQTRQPGKP